MKIQVITLGVWPTIQEAQHRSWIFLASCARFGIEPRFFGIGMPFDYWNWAMMKVDYQLDYLKSGMLSDCTHVLYTDSLDSLLFGGLDEIEERYRSLGSPAMLVSAHHGVPGKEWGRDYDAIFPSGVVYRTPYVGGYLGELSAVIESFEILHRTPLVNQRKDDVFVWWNAWEAGWRPTLDSACSIFQASSDGLDDNCQPRPFNVITETFPSVVHWHGGSQDPNNPRGWKDGMMEIYARRWGIIQ